MIFNAEFFIWDAVVAWRDYIFSQDFYTWSKSNYLTNMLKLVESDIIDVRLVLSSVNVEWLEECKVKIDGVAKWAKSTKTARKTILNSFYSFVINIFDGIQIPYQRHPKKMEVKHALSPQKEDEHKYDALETSVLKHVLSNVVDKAKARDLCPIILCNALSKINERDAYVIWLMMYTGQPLDKVLDIKKEQFRVGEMSPEEAKQRGLDSQERHAHFAYLNFYVEEGEHIPGHVVNGINKACKNSSVFLFETENGNRLLRTQITRNLKKAGRVIGLDFDLTPKILHGYVCGYMTKDKRSDLQKSMGVAFD